MAPVSTYASGARLRPVAVAGKEAAACMVVMGGAFAGMLQVQTANVMQALMGAALGAGLALALILLAADTVRWDHLLSAAAVIVCAALCQKYGALARYTPGEQRLMMFKANVVAGWLLYLGHLGFGACQPDSEPA